MRAVLHAHGSLALDIFRYALQHTAAAGDVKRIDPALYFLQLVQNRRQDLLQLEFNSFRQLFGRDHEIAPYLCGSRYPEPYVFLQTVG